MKSRYSFFALAAVACLISATGNAQQTNSAKKQATSTATKKKSAQPAISGTATAVQSPSAARAVERPIPREQLTPIPRVTIPGGSLGYESQTSLRAYDMSDGRRVPGYDNIQRNDSSYFGLSIRMPTGGLLRSHAPD